MKSILWFVLIVMACTPKPEDAEALLLKANNAHGTSTFESRTVEFDFRDRHYSVVRKGDEYIYTRVFTDSTGLVIDSLINSSKHARWVNGQVITLTKEWHDKYTNSVNSVLYFFQIPYTLNDPAAHREYAGKFSIRGADYQAFNVTFSQEGGGKDFEDEFLYWVNEKSGTIDYFSYNYITDGGGVRFREAINRRYIEGLLVQDYINYKPDSKFTPLRDLPSLLESGQLEEVSRIMNENISVY